MTDAIRSMPDLALWFMAGCTLWILARGLVVIAFIVAKSLAYRDDADDNRLWDPEDCQRPPLRSPYGVPLR